MKLGTGNKNERAVALIITLILLGMVTVMAIIFLALTRRERSSVKLSEDVETSKMMADAALERAKAQAVANMAAGGSKLNYDLFVSTDFYPAPGLGYNKSVTKPDTNNVGYTYPDGRPLQGDDQLRMLGNLFFDPRPPVFVPTNDATGASEFRFYLDFNRNGLFETNGVLSQLDTNGIPFGPATNRYVGDPEWVGVLERPTFPHSESNRFVGRYAFLALPSGKSFDANFIHNQSMIGADDNLLPGNAKNGFMRNQGYGSWEINLAAFLRELNTNVWDITSYRNYNPLSVTPAYPQGSAFNNARAFLDFRYLHRRASLFSASASLAPNAASVLTLNKQFQTDGIDNYGTGPITLDYAADDSAATQPARPWPGSLNTNAFTDVQQFYTFGDSGYSPLFTDFTTSLKLASTRSKSSYDRYTLYRMLAQMGVDSTPALKGKIHLNYENSVGQATNNSVPWTNSVRFFTNAANLMFQASVEQRVYQPDLRRAVYFTNYFVGDTRVRTNFSITNILFYSLPYTNVFKPTDELPILSEYTPATRRILQVAANIYDNMTNNHASASSPYPYFPTVFRPIFSKTLTNISVTGFFEETNTTFLLYPWTNVVTWMQLHRTATVVPTNMNFYGQPIIVGVKKGHPNFNELSLDSSMEVSRRLELAKPRTGGRVSFTNQMFLVSMTNRWGIEGWNSYTNTYRWDVSVFAQVDSTVAISNKVLSANQTFFTTNAVPVNGFVAHRMFTNRLTTIPFNASTGWVGATLFAPTNRNLRVFLDQAFPVVTNQPFVAGFFPAFPTAVFSPIDASPRFQVYTTNNVLYWAVATDPVSKQHRIIDITSFGNLTTFSDLSTNLYTPSSPLGVLNGKSQAGGPIDDNLLWDPTPTNNINLGVLYQIKVSNGEVPVTSKDWKNYRFAYPDKDFGIDTFRAFLGMSPLSHQTPAHPQSSYTNQAPFVPTRLMHRIFSWQVNDPLVHALPTELQTPVNPPYSQAENIKPGLLPTPWNIGVINLLYSPWGRLPAGNPYAFNIGLQDPGIRGSDDWHFPILQTPAGNNFYRFPSIGELGGVHRGTPWQTIYLKSVVKHQPLANGLFSTNLIPVPDPVLWAGWAGTVGTYPGEDYKLLDVFTTAPNENAVRGLLSVNQANRAAWSAVLSGVPVQVNSQSDSLALINRTKGGPYRTGIFTNAIISPATPQITNIVNSINAYRSQQFEIIPLYNPTRPAISFILGTNTTTHGYFQHIGDLVGAPGLSLESPYLRMSTNQVYYGMLDDVVERLPRQILSLVQKDEPRFVVYSFGQSLKPAPHSLATSADFYNLCTNYQITGEVITKTTFRVEGDLRDPNNPLHTVIEDHRVLPPPE